MNENTDSDFDGLGVMVADDSEVDTGDDGSSSKMSIIEKPDFNLIKCLFSKSYINGISTEALATIIREKTDVFGTILFDYGYANSPKGFVKNTTKQILGKIEYDYDQYDTTREGLLDLIGNHIPVEVLPNTIFLLDGHTDRVSNHEFNQKLSEARAESIKQILVEEFKISEENIITQGHSWDELAVDTTEECAENRRVEIKFIIKTEN